MRRLIAILITAATLLASLPAAAELVVIANPECGMRHLDRGDIINIFMGRYLKFPSGVIALPVDLTTDKTQFYNALVNKNLAEINSYWARLVFSGRASPPRQVPDDSEMLDIVRNNRGAIGYISESSVDSSVVVLFRFGADKATP